MQFSINKEFADRYNTYRRKEELQKLKERYGDVKLKKEKPEDDQTVVDQSDNDESSSVSSSDDDDEEDTYSSSAEREHEDFLVLYEALCKNDPQLDDPSKKWFHDAEDDTSRDPDNSTAVSHTDETDQARIERDTKKKKEKSDKHEVLTLRDYDRQFLLEQGGVEEESQAAEAAKVAKLESDILLDKLDRSETNESKALFLREADEALKRSGVKANDATSVVEEPTTAGFLTRRKLKMDEDGTAKRRKVKVNVDNLLFTDQPNSEAEAFLRDYIINQRWRHPSARVPTYSEVLQSANIDEEEETKSDVRLENATNAFADDTILDEDDDFLIRVHDFERNQLEAGVKPVKHRFEEEDKEFIKSYPRKIESSVHQVAASQARSSRAEKRQARRQRKLEEKQAKMAELNRLRRLKLMMYADKIERIKRSCGAGCDLTAELNEDDIHMAEMKQLTETECDGTSAPSSEKLDAKAALNLAMHLDEDWDPEKHDQLLANMFNENYYKVHEDSSQIPQFSEDEEEDDGDADTIEGSDGSVERHVNNPVEADRNRPDASADAPPVKNKKRHSLTALDSQSAGDELAVQESGDQVESVRRRRRLRGKARLRRALEREKELYDPTVYPDYETYFQKYYHLNCEDVIPGPTPDEDVFCRFKYRKVTPNDFGLSTEEVLTATPGELNSWVPITRVTAYRTEEEEERDQRLFHSNHKLQKKTRVIASLSDPNAHWWPSAKAQGGDGGETSTSSSRRKRSKRKRKRAHDAVTAVHQTLEMDVKPVKKTDFQRVNGISISAARLKASGLSVKDLHKARKQKPRPDPQNSEASSVIV